MNQTSITFLGLGLTLFVWASGSALTNYLATSPARELKAKAHAEIDGGAEIENSVSLAESKISKLTAEVNQTPENVELRLQLANLLFESGLRFQKADFLKESVGHFHEVLVKDPNQREALLGLATLSLHVGVGEKSAEYYTRYLKIVPDDQSAKANLALALHRSGKSKEAITLIDEVLKNDSKFVIALVTKGIILKESGSLKEATSLFETAEKIESNPVLLERIAALKEIKAEGNSNDSKNSDDSHPNLIAYFKNHPILKNKFVDLKILDGIAEVEIKEFPIEAMPEFAKNKFIASLTKVISDNNLKSLKLIDSISKKVLLTI